MCYDRLPFILLNKAHCPAPYIYIGCYADLINNRDLDGLGAAPANQLGTVSVETCVEYCRTLGFVYAGLQNR